MIRPVSLAVGLVALAGCAGVQEHPTPGGGGDPPEALLPIVRVAAGEPDTVALGLLGSTVQFGEHPDARLRPLDGGRVVVETPSEFSGLAQVPVDIDGDAYVLVVESVVWPEVVFRFEPSLRPLQVATAPEVAVVFADGRPSLPLTDPERDAVLEGTTRLPPGRHFYTLIVDGEERLDPANPDTIRDASGRARNTIEVTPVPPGHLVLEIVGPDPESPDVLEFSLLRFDATGNEVPSEIEEEEGVVALLDNRPFEDNAIDAHADYVRLDLDAAGPGRQRLRVAARVDGLVSNWIAVDLVDGRLATD